MAKKLPFEEGSWFLLPLGEAGYASGVVARVSPKHRAVLLGYFFDELFATPPPLEHFCKRTASGAGLTLIFGYLGLRDGAWPVIGRCENWRAEDWPMPAFVNEELLTGRRYEIRYDDKDPNKEVSRRLLSENEGRFLPVDGVSGDVAVQITMGKRLGLPTEKLLALRGSCMEGKRRL